MEALSCQDILDEIHDAAPFGRKESMIAVRMRELELAEFELERAALRLEIKALQELNEDDLNPLLRGYWR